MKRFTIGLLITAGMAIGLDAAPLREYHFVIPQGWLAQFHLADPQGAALEVFVGEGQPTTTAYRVTVKYQNQDGSVAVVGGIFDRGQGPGDTLCYFRAANAAKVVSVVVEELASSSSQEFVQ